MSSVICAHSRRTATLAEVDTAVETSMHRAIVSLTIIYGTFSEGSNHTIGAGSPAAVPPPAQSIIETARSLPALRILLAKSKLEVTAVAGSPKSEKIAVRNTPVAAGNIGLFPPARYTSQ